MLLLVVVLVVGVFYGISITKEGIGRIHGPLDGAVEAEDAPDRWLEADAGDAGGRGPVAGAKDNGQEQPEGLETDPYGKPASATDSALSRLAGKAGELARLLADGLIRLLVGLGDAVLS